MLTSPIKEVHSTYPSPSPSYMVQESSVWFWILPQKQMYRLQSPQGTDKGLKMHLIFQQQVVKTHFFLIFRSLDYRQLICNMQIKTLSTIYFHGPHSTQGKGQTEGSWDLPILTVFA